MTKQTFTRGRVATALKLDVRQLESWAAQRLITPAVRRGQTQNGNRRAYSFADVVAAAVLSELQNLLGKTGVRPGSLAALLAKELRSHEYDLLVKIPPPYTFLVVQGVEGRPSLEVLYLRAGAQGLPMAAITIRLDVLVARVRRALADA